MDSAPARARECDCPPWVIKCVHYGTRGIALVAVEATYSSGIPHDKDHYWDTPYALISLPLIKCNSCGITHKAPIPVSLGKNGFYNKGAALAAFAQAEAELLAREPAP